MTTECPDQQLLQLLLLGKLNGPELATLEAHLSQCHQCAKAAETIVVDDDLTAAIRSAPEVSAVDSALAEAIAASKLLVRSVGSGSVGDTSSIAFDESHSRADLSWNESGQWADLDLSFLQPAESDEELGRLGEYRILGVLGVGGMGIVFRAEDVQLKREVALKAMKPNVAANKTAKDRFLHEARSAAAIDHEHIVHIYQVGEDRGVPFIAMQFLRGESMRTRLERDGSLDQDMVIRIGREVAAGLSAAHEQGMIHRDIKPDNIWLQTTGDGPTTDFRVKLLDFGLVRSLDDDPGLTTSGILLGTPRYMSPEQAQGEDIDHRSDLFSLGSMLYHAVTGTAPFSGTNVASTLIAVVSKQPAAIAKVAPRIDRPLASAIESMLAKKRDDRPATAAEVSNTLASIAEGRLQQASQPTTESKPVRGSRRESLPWLIGGVSAALLLIACGVVFLLQTPEGTLRIEVDDPNLTVLVDGDEINFSGKTWEGEKPARKHRLAIKLGEQEIPMTLPHTFTLSEDGLTYQLSADRNGVALTSRDFEVTRREKTVLKISLQAQPRVSRPAAAAIQPVGDLSAADRLVADLTPTFVEEFATDESFPANENDPEREITGGRSVMTWPAESNRRGIWVWALNECDDGILDISGRIVAGRRADGDVTRWMVMLHKANNPGPGLLVRVADDRVSTEKSIYDKRFSGDPNRKQFMTSQSELDTEFHRLQLLVEGSKRLVTIFHDGVQVGPPIELDGDFTPARFFLGMEHQDRGVAGVVEVERYAFYPLPKQPNALASSSAEEQRFTPDDGWIDLLPLANLTHSEQPGNWKLDNGVLKNVIEGTDFLPLPVEIAGDYELLMRFSRDDDSNSGFGVKLPLGDQHTSAQHFGFGKYHGISRVEGYRFFKASNPTHRVDPIASGQEYESLLKVTKTGDSRYLIVCRFNGQEFYDYEGEVDDMADTAYELPIRRVVISSGGIPIQSWHTVRLRMLNGEATLVDHR